MYGKESRQRNKARQGVVNVSLSLTQTCLSGVNFISRKENPQIFANRQTDTDRKASSMGHEGRL